MAKENPNNNAPRRSFPGSFLLFLIAVIIAVVVVQSFMQQKEANIAFSYQLESLVDLDLLEPEESRKIALNDNLVSFSGKFRDAETDVSKQRYKYLSLLHANHVLQRDQTAVLQELTDERQKTLDAADFFLRLTGASLPRGGYRVVGPSFDVNGQDNSIILTTLSSRDLITLPEVESELRRVQRDPTDETLKQLGNDFEELLRNFRSPVLGIGDEGMKQDLKQNVEDIEKAAALETAPRLAVYEAVIGQLNSIVSQLSTLQDHARLSQLRSVRNYQAALDQYQQIATNLDQNEAQLDKARRAVADVVWYYNNKELSTRALEKQDPEQFDQWFANAQEEWEHFDTNRSGYFKAPDQPRNLVLEKMFKSEEPSPNYLGYFFTVLPVILVVLLLYFVFSRQMKGVGGSAMNFGKSPARMFTKERVKVTFKDVAGVEEAKEELMEIVDFLRNPGKFTALGARIPKGVLCVGPPGCGKTLIAKAVAGEADRPFFSISGSEFVEMFVGVGASRIRDLFDQAKKNAPCIIFMDEIDAVGRHRGAGMGGGHDEREQTLNQLLVEMDGFDSNEGIILMAATNRPDVLDRALLRPGRFDRQVVLDLPDLRGRLEILKVHARKIRMDDGVDLMSIARSTPGASGADLQNLLNEAALMAARKGRTAVTVEECNEARDKVRYGKERRSLEIGETEKKTTAYHEAGHTIVGMLVKKGDPVDKVTIIPRGLSLGATHFLPEKNRLNFWKSEAYDRLAVMMGGRAAEEVFLGDVSSGAQQDIRQATQLVRSMVCEWGMSDELGLVAYDERSDSGRYLGQSSYNERAYSEETAEEIDKEVREIIQKAYDQAKKIMIEHRATVELMAQMLIEFETLDAYDLKKMVANEWNVEEKRERLKAAALLSKKAEATPPPPPPLPPATFQEKKAT